MENRRRCVASRSPPRKLSRIPLLQVLSLFIACKRCAAFCPRISGGLRTRAPTRQAVSTQDSLTPELERRRAFQENGGLIYLPRFLDYLEAMAVAQEAPALIRRATKEHGSIARGRLVAEVPKESNIHRIFTGDQVKAALKSVAGEEEMFASGLPVELRLYPRWSRMGWHYDDVLFARPQYEVIYTLENTSDSLTEWEDKSGARHAVSTEPNSLLVVKAGGPCRHRVTCVWQGRRVVIKAAMTPTTEAGEALQEHLEGSYF
ncbi:unnamed protein product [Discosporangium mesarthrocarpum]